MKIRTVTEIVKGLLKKADGEGRIAEMKDKIREHLARARDSGNDKEILARFLYENEGQPRAIRAMNLQAQMDGEDARVSDTILLDQAFERRKPLTEARIVALSEAFPFHAKGDDTVVDEVESVIEHEECVAHSEAFYDYAEGEEEDIVIEDPMFDDVDVQALAYEFENCVSINKTDLADELKALIKQHEEKEMDIEKIAASFPHPCVIH